MGSAKESVLVDKAEGQPMQSAQQAVYLYTASLVRWMYAILLAYLYPGGTETYIDPAVRDVCVSLSSKQEKQERYGQIIMPSSSEFTSYRLRVYKQASLQPTGVFCPETPGALCDAIALIGQRRIPFAISSGRHSNNVGFSATQGGLQIDLRRFRDIHLAADKSYADLGVGLTWTDVYRRLEGSGVTVLGGRADSVGVGGFLAGGGGFGWTTNQYGLTANTALEAELVTPNGEIKTVSNDSDPDLFWALRGGGNRFGIVFRWRLKTQQRRSELVYGGSRVYIRQKIEAVNEAVADFAANNKDPKAQLMVSYATLYGLASFAVVMIAYDGDDPGDAFAMFDEDKLGKPIKDGWGKMTFAEMVAMSSDGHGGRRGLMEQASFVHFNSPTLLNAIAKESQHWGKQLFRRGALPRSHTLVSYLVEPFQQHWGAGYKDTQGAWPYHSSPMPLCIYYSWFAQRDDAFFQNAVQESKKKLLQLARQEGQDVDTVTNYPNYAQKGTQLECMFGKENLQRLQALRKRYDPDDVMGLTSYFF